MASDALRTLAEQLRSEDTVISPRVAEPKAPAALGNLVASGPATAQDPDAYALVIESVREGYLLHYGEPRVIAGADPDLKLLAGDYLYALGLERLAGLGDLDAVRELSDLISIGAQLHGDDESERPEPGGESLWLATTLAIATGDASALEEAKFALMQGNPGGEEAARSAAAKIASASGLADSLAEARQAIQSSSST